MIAGSVIIGMIISLLIKLIREGGGIIPDPPKEKEIINPNPPTKHVDPENNQQYTFDISDSIP